MNRDEIAVKLLQAMLSNPNIKEEDFKHNSIVAVRNADALIETLHPVTEHENWTKRLQPPHLQTHVVTTNQRV